jgi:hypothetical protein
MIRFLWARVAKRVLDSLAGNTNEMVRGDIESHTLRYDERLPALDSVFDPLMNGRYSILEKTIMDYQFSQGPAWYTKTCR